MGQDNRFTNILKKVFLGLFIITTTLGIAYFCKSSPIGIANGSQGLTVGEITEGITITQTFTSPYSGLNGFSVFFATYGRSNVGNITVFLTDDTVSRCVYGETFSAETLLDNSYRDFTVPAQLNCHNHNYTITITSDADTSNGVTIWGTSDIEYSQGTATINGELLDMDIGFKVYYDKSLYILPPTIIAGVLLLFLHIILVVIKESFFLTVLHKVAVSIWAGLASGCVIAILYAYYFLNVIEFRALASLSTCMRILIFGLAACFTSCLFLLDCDRHRDFIFQKRWSIAIIIFAVLVLFKVNFSNISCFDDWIQPDIETPFSKPFLGETREIRGDEWLISTPCKVSASYSDFGKYNSIVRGTSNYNISATGLYRSYSALSNPFHWGYYLFGVEYGFSWYWCGLLIMSFMVSFELSLIISNQKRNIALLGGCLIGLSACSLWWSIIPQIVSSEALVVCGYYFLKTDCYIKRVLLAFCTALSGAYFVTQLYPAWQVPLAYILIIFLLWLIIDNIEILRNFSIRDWLLVMSTLAFMGSIILSFLYDNRVYIEQISNTLYPGARRSVGEYSLYKPEFYIQSLFYPINDCINTSEAAVFFNLFPIPMIWGGYIFVREVIDKIRQHSKKIDILNALMLIPTVFLTVYCTKGLPEQLAKVTLMDHSTGPRAVDILGLLNVYFIIRLFGNKDNQYRFPIAVGAIIIISNIIKSIIVSISYFGNYMTYSYICIISVATFWFGMAMLCKLSISSERLAVSVITALVGISGIGILPMTRGLDSLLEKPASYAIRNIVSSDPDAKWMTLYDEAYSAQFVVGNGGACISSVNYIPNLELWSALDPGGRYLDIYNRYCHVAMDLTSEQTSFELANTDCIRVHLSYLDIEKAGVGYIFSLIPVIAESDMVNFNLIYHESNVYIYDIDFR